MLEATPRPLTAAVSVDFAAAVAADRTPVCWRVADRTIAAAEADGDTGEAAAADRCRRRTVCCFCQTVEHPSHRHLYSLSSR